MSCGSGNEALSDAPPPPGPNDFTPVGLSCEVANAIAACNSCHSAPPKGGAPMPLRTDADLKALSTTAAPNGTRKLSYAELSVLRMQDPNRPMPPEGATPTQAADIAALQNWISANYPAGSCGNVSDAGVMVHPTVCTSGVFTIGEDLRDHNQMHPGGACNTCHASQGGDRPIFTIAGTVYSTFHEKDDCNAVSSVRGSQVIITGADGKVQTLTVNATGNFLSEQRVALPFQAKVIQNGKEHVMATAQTVGDCNSCHSEQGAGGAPGRITAP